MKFTEMSKTDYVIGHGDVQITSEDNQDIYEEQTDDNTIRLGIYWLKPKTSRLEMSANFQFQNRFQNVKILSDEPVVYLVYLMQFLVIKLAKGDIQWW